MQNLEEIIYRYKNKYDGYSNSRLAVKICQKENLNISADTLRKLIPKLTKTKPNEISLEEKETDFDLPETDYKERKPFVLPKSENDILILGDIHIPYHDNESLRLALRYGKDRGVNTIILNGDIIDFYSVSRFVRMPDKRDTYLEVKRTKEFFQALRKLFPSQSIYYKKGNHEERWDVFIAEKAPELWKMDNVKFENIMDLDSFGIQLVGDQRTIEAGMLNIIHGHELKGFSGGVNVARTARLKTLDNVLTHHFHTHQDDSAKNLKNKIQGGFAIGCLCGLSPDYMPINRWINGFARVTIENSGFFNVENKKIIHGQIK